MPDDRGLRGVSPAHHGCRSGLACEWEEIRPRPSSEGVVVVGLNGRGRGCGTMHDMSINFPTEVQGLTAPVVESSRVRVFMFLFVVVVVLVSVDNRLGWWEKVGGDGRVDLSST